MIPQDAAVEPGLRDYVQVLRRRKTSVVVSIIIFLGVALGSSFVQKPRYAAVAKLLLRPRSAGSVFNSTGAATNANTDRAVQTEIEVVETEPVRDLVRAKIGTAPPVHVRPVGQSDVVEIRADSADPKQAAIIANAYATAYIDFRRKQSIDELSSASEEVQVKIADLQKQLDALGSQLAAAPACVDPKTTADACSQRANIEQTVASRRTTLLSQLGLFQQKLDQLQVDSALATGSAQLVTPAVPALAPFKPTPLRNALLGIIFGLGVGMGVALLKEHLDDSIKGKDDFERSVPGMTVLGLIPLVGDWKESEGVQLVSTTDPKSTAAEAYRILRTSIQFMGLDRSVRVIQVTSPNAQEGKSTTLANLAVAFAASGMRTIAVDCDLRRPRLHKFFDLDNSVGFTSVLLGTVSLTSALQAVRGQDRLLVLPSGPQPPNPSELLSSGRTTDLLRSLGSQADIVLIDSPPTLPVTDALILSQRADSVVLVTTAGMTTQKAANRATEMLRHVNAPVAGAIVNGVSAERGYGGRYSYGYYTHDGGSPNGTTTIPDSVDASTNPAKRRHRRRRRSAV